MKKAKNIKELLQTLFDELVEQGERKIGLLTLSRSQNQLSD
jgi:hypothetical protein